MQNVPHKLSGRKQANNYARVVKWNDIKHNIPTKLKVSPVAMIPHKSRAFRCILDLSFQLNLKGKKMPSVNSATAKLAPREGMVQLGQALKRAVRIYSDIGAET